MLRMFLIVSQKFTFSSLLPIVVFIYFMYQRRKPLSEYRLSQPSCFCFFREIRGLRAVLPVQMALVAKGLPKTTYIFETIEGSTGAALGHSTAEIDGLIPEIPAMLEVPL